MTMPSPPPNDSQATVEHCPTCRTELSELKRALQDVEDMLAQLDEMVVAIGQHVGAEGFVTEEDDGA